MLDYTQSQLPKRYHEALVEWHRRHFPDLAILEKYWSQHFSDIPEFQLVAKVAPLREGSIEFGMFKGQPKINRAVEMKGNMLFSALRIIKAQCSTELGSIQQHMGTVDRCTSDRAKFSILRMMAEELRHGYQMFWVLSQDDSWAQAGIRNVAEQAMEELLEMKTGTHVLDAFNLPFHDTLDNIVFAFLIDRVGKYQLTMQKVFSYAPMAQSMPVMLQEESFHLRTGYELLRDVCALAATDRGAWSLDEVQKRLYAWYPRGAEMFGNPDGGQANITFGFKDRLNGECLEAWQSDVARLTSRISFSTLEARWPTLSRAQLIERLEGGEPGILRLPHHSFFRVRGEEDVVHQPIDVDGKRLPKEEYPAHLERVLPESLRGTSFFRNYLSALSD